MQPAQGAYYPPPSPRTNGMAVGALVTSLAGVIFTAGMGSFVGAILGHIALGQIKRTGEQGRGMALAGVIIGWVSAALWIIGVIVFIIAVVAVSQNTQSG